MHDIRSLRDHLLVMLRRRWTYPEEDIEDAIQDALVALHEALGKVRHPRAFALRVAENKLVDCTNARRAQQALRRRVDASRGRILGGPSMDGEADIIERERWLRLDAAVEQYILNEWKHGQGATCLVVPSITDFDTAAVRAKLAYYLGVIDQLPVAERQRRRLQRLFERGVNRARPRARVQLQGDIPSGLDDFIFTERLAIEPTSPATDAEDEPGPETAPPPDPAGDDAGDPWDDAETLAPLIHRGARLALLLCRKLTYGEAVDLAEQAAGAVSLPPSVSHQPFTYYWDPMTTPAYLAEAEELRYYLELLQRSGEPGASVLSAATCDEAPVHVMASLERDHVLVEAASNRTLPAWTAILPSGIEQMCARGWAPPSDGVDNFTRRWDRSDRDWPDDLAYVIVDVLEQVYSWDPENSLDIELYGLD